MQRTHACIFARFARKMLAGIQRTLGSEEHCLRDPKNGCGSTPVGILRKGIRSMLCESFAFATRKEIQAYSKSLRISKDTLECWIQATDMS
jgi:hypothetical protein